jgi:hypothetical protein
MLTISKEESVKINDAIEEKKITRRSLLSGVGKIAFAGAGIAALSGGLDLFSTAEAKEPRALPWPYKKVDPDEAAEIAYQDWYDKYCGYAAISGIMKPLRKSVGEPYSSFPMDVGIYLFGGGVTWGAMCGALVGSGIPVSMITGDFGCLFPKGKHAATIKQQTVTFNGLNIMNDLINWYCDTELPVYKPKKPEMADYTPEKSKSDSPLCHARLEKWMKSTGHEFGSPERYEMCARLTADVAKQTALYLNALADGKYQEGTKMAPVIMHRVTTQHNCNDCHGKDFANNK